MQTNGARHFGICEERRSGVDKVMSLTGGLPPAPEFAIVSDPTRATLFAHKELAKMDKIERVRACYLHACLRYVQREYMTNATLRERFGITIATASRLIKEAVDAGMLRPYDAAPRKFMKYVPYWA
ncbi:hypothetical protein [Cupriavidus oxalaticus]|uniref:hypothetical protein n=1 Tax=Cupriavidus oxalaticus TaxID=96344 RepID=UPI001F0DB9AE|nr:hypothetical protein [Cupriavidus oxalaticus]